MDAPNNVPDQGREEGQQPIELPVHSDKVNPQATSDSSSSPVNKTVLLLNCFGWLPQLSVSQQEEQMRHILSTEPFQPILMIADLERDDPKLAFQVARLVGLYRRLWESCVPKHLDGEKLEQNNQILREANMHLGCFQLWSCTALADPFDFIHTIDSWRIFLISNALSLGLTLLHKTQRY